MVGNKPEEEALRTLLVKGSLTGVIYTTDDCAASFEKLRAALRA